VESGEWKVDSRNGLGVGLAGFYIVTNALIFFIPLARICNPRP